MEKKKAKNKISIDSLLSDTNDVRTDGGTNDKTTESIEKEIEEKPKEKTREEINAENVLKNLDAYSEAPKDLHPVKERKKYTRKNKEENKSVGLPISGKFFITVTDRVYTNLILALDRVVTKTSDIKTTDISMSVEERDDLIPLADECLKKMMIEGDPITQFFAGMAALTITKYFMVKNDKKIKDDTH